MVMMPYSPMSETIKIDLRDKKILYELYRDARQSDSAIAKKVGLSREAIDYRIKNLEKKGIIEKYITLVDNDALGYTSYNVYISLANVNEKEIENVAHSLSNWPFVKWVAVCSGQWDLILTVAARDKFHLDSMLEKISSKFHQIKKYDVLTTIKLYKDVDIIFLIPEKKVFYEEKTPQKIKINETDKEILHALSENARMNVIDIAKIVKLTPEAVSYRIKRLQKAKIIRGFRACIDVSKLGYLWCMLLCEIKNLSKEKEKDFIAFCNANKNIFFVDKLIGKWQLRVELLAENLFHFHSLLTQLRNSLSDSMNSYELIMIFRSYKEISYFKGM
jgi:DNA-binding Lrp family transcriptional regulator